MSWKAFGVISFSLYSYCRACFIFYRDIAY